MYIIMLDSIRNNYMINVLEHLHKYVPSLTTDDSIIDVIRISENPLSFVWKISTNS